MPQMVQHLDLLNEVFERLPSHVAFAEFFDGDFGAEPACFENVTVATTTDKICLRIDFQFFKVDKEVKTIFAK